MSEETPITTFGTAVVRRANGGFAVRTGVRAGSKMKTADKHQQAVTDFIKG